MDDNTGSLNVAEELVTQSDALGCPLNEAGHIRDDKASAVAEIDNAQIRLDCRERVIRNLRLRVGHAGQEC